MQPFGRIYHARLLRDGDRIALWLDDSRPGLLLRFALTERGTERAVFPALILDDWGDEIKGRRLYRWFRENADQYPRAEVFGVDLTGAAVQRFVRELEPFYRFHCYAYADADAPLDSGQLVEAVIVPDPARTATAAMKRSAEIDPLLSWSRLTWWAAPPALADQFSFASLPPSRSGN